MSSYLLIYGRPRISPKKARTRVDIAKAAIALYKKKQVRSSV
jgi:hypothetical protein